MVKQQGRGIEWKDGMPHPVYHPPLNTQSYAALVPAALATPYVMYMTDENGFQRDVTEEEFMGMTCAEVAWIRTARRAAAGDLDALKECSDRFLGKAKQHIEQTVHNETLGEFLESLRVSVTEDPVPETHRIADPPTIKDIQAYDAEETIDIEEYEYAADI